MNYKSILILGKGYVGMRLFAYLHESKKQNKISIKSRKDLNYHSKAVLSEYINANDIDLVINCSGFTGRPNVDQCEKRKWDCWNLNVVVPTSINQACIETCTEYMHISSGCIYNGYKGVGRGWTEEDRPNFGLDNKSSFYSKSKHAFEELAKDCCILRVRMPFDDDFSERSYLSKILKYDNLINYVNSKTYIPDLCRFVDRLIVSGKMMKDVGIVNVVNPAAGDAVFVTDILIHYGLENKRWSFVPLDDLDIVAPRSNCILNTTKVDNMFSDFTMLSELQSLEQACSRYTTK
jgi:dTDP-4-dehydrorhamnose reductase